MTDPAAWVSSLLICRPPAGALPAALAGRAHPSAGRDLEVVEAPSGAAVGPQGGGVAVQLGLEQANRRLGKGVEAVTDGPDRGCGADLGEPVGVAIDVS